MPLVAVQKHEMPQERKTVHETVTEKKPEFRLKLEIWHLCIGPYAQRLIPGLKLNLV